MISQGLFVCVSSMSFLIPPNSYPARCGLLITTLLVDESYAKLKYFFLNLKSFPGVGQSFQLDGRHNPIGRNQLDGAKNFF